jgi:hypothetical protein
MDYRLENEYGDQVIDQALKIIQELGDKVKFKLIFVALSSTEDTIVKNNLMDRGVLKI